MFISNDALVDRVGKEEFSEETFGLEEFKFNAVYVVFLMIDSIYGGI